MNSNNISKQNFKEVNITVTNLKPGLHLSCSIVSLEFSNGLMLNGSTEIFFEYSNEWHNSSSFLLYYLINFSSSLLSLLPILPPSNIQQAFLLHQFKKEKKQKLFFTDSPWLRKQIKHSSVWQLMPFMTRTLHAFSASPCFTQFHIIPSCNNKLLLIL